MRYYFIVKDRNEERTLILVKLWNGKQSIKISTGIKGNPKYFDGERFSKKEEEHKGNNYLLLSWQREIEKAILEGQVLNLTLQQIKERVLINMGKLDRNKTSDKLLPYFKKWSQTSTTTRQATRQMYYSYTLFEEYCIANKLSPSFNDMNLPIAEGYIEYMANKGLNPNTRGCHIKNLKAVMSKAFKEQLHSNQSFMQFRTERNEVDSVYLTNDEVKRLEQLDLVGTKKLVRDLFLIGCYTAMRFSDYSRLCGKDLETGYIRQTQQKTGQRVVIPVHPIVRKIINEYGGTLPTISQQKFNSIIKDVCRNAEIEERIAVTENTIKGKVTTYYEKWELVSSHTARRTAATNMFKSGIPTLSIMQITGHKTEKSFLLYIRVTKEENAEQLSKSKFFNE